MLESFSETSSRPSTSTSTRSTCTWPPPIDWDTELECLLAGEVAPFDEPSGDEDDEKNDH
jgi:hypothetical protein